MRYPQLFERTKLISPIEASEWEEFSIGLAEGTAAKGDILSRPGEEAKYIWIVQRGIIRNYDLDDKGKEYTKVFRGPGEMVGSYPEILAKTPTRFFIQSVTDTEFLRLTYSVFEKMMDKYKSWERLGRILAERNFLEKEKREYDLMHLSAEERYNEIKKQYGELLNSIPQFQIATTLAISPEALNRILKRKLAE
jgi:CRP-like cAMP-binding protein